MSDWRSIELQSLSGELRRGLAPSYVTDSTVYAIGQRCVRNEGFDSSRVRPHDENAARLQAKPGDVLLNSTGTGTIGRSCVFGATDATYVVDGHVTLIRPDPKQADGRYLNETLRSANGQRHLASTCFTGSTNQVELSRSELARFVIQTPPLEEQRRIAEILGTIDETIQATERLIAKLTKAHEALRQDLLPSTPSEGVEEVPLGDLVDRQRPIVYGILMPGKHVHGGVPVIKVRDIKEGAIAPKESLLHADQRIDVQFIRSRVLAGDLLFTIRGTVGRTAVVSSELSHANITQDTARIAILGADQSYVLAAMKGASFARFIEINTVGQAVKGINLRELRRAPVLMVGREKQGRIGRMLDTSRSQLTAELNKLKKYRILRNGLASDLLSRKVRTVAE